MVHTYVRGGDRTRSERSARIIEIADENYQPHERFLSRELAELVSEEMPNFANLLEDSQRNIVQQALREAGFNKAMVGKAMHWSRDNLPPIVGAWKKPAQPPRERGPLSDHRKYLTLLYYRFKRQPFTVPEAVEYLSAANGISSETARVYTNRVLGAGLEKPAETMGRRIKTRRIQRANGWRKQPAVWEIIDV